MGQGGAVGRRKPPATTWPVNLTCDQYVSKQP